MTATPSWVGWAQPRRHGPRPPQQLQKRGLPRGTKHTGGTGEDGLDAVNFASIANRTQNDPSNFRVAFRETQVLLALTQMDPRMFPQLFGQDVVAIHCAVWSRQRIVHPHPCGQTPPRVWYADQGRRGVASRGPLLTVPTSSSHKKVDGLL